STRDSPTSSRSVLRTDATPLALIVPSSTSSTDLPSVSHARIVGTVNSTISSETTVNGTDWPSTDSCFNPERPLPYSRALSVATRGSTDVTRVLAGDCPMGGSTTLGSQAAAWNASHRAVSLPASFGGLGMVIGGYQGETSVGETD